MSQVITEAIRETAATGSYRLKAVIYVRISKDRENETSTGTQEHEARLYCQLKGWDVLAVCIDPGRSAFKRGVKRPELEKALELIECKAADVLVVWKLNRFTRSVTDFWDYWSRINKAGGAFASVTESLDSSTAMGRGVIGLLASFAEMESEVKSDQAKAWNDGRLRDGLAPQGQRPYGYERHSGQLHINESEADIIRQAAARIVAGGSLKSIIRDFKPVSSRGMAMTPRGLRSTLMNPTTAGYRKGPAGLLVEGNWPAILKPELWEQVCDVLSDVSRKTSPSNGHKHLLSGIMTCGKPECNGSKVGARNWVTRKQEQAQRYQCLNCGNSIWLKDADEAVSARLLALVGQDDWQALKTQGRGYDPAVIQSLEDEAAQYVAMATKGTIKPEQLETIMEGINARMASAMGDEPLDLPDVEHLADGWDGMTLLDKRRCLKGLLSAVVLNPANGVRGIARLQTERVA